jgi:hypothetical protein
MPIAARFAGRRGDRSEAATIGTAGSPSRAIVLFVWLWMFAELSAALLQRRMYQYHFLPLVCPLALLYGMLPRPARPAQVLLGLLPVALLGLRWEGSDIRRAASAFSRNPASEYVARHTTPGDSVFADQIGTLLIETDRLPGTRYGTFFYFVNYDRAPLDYSRGMIADFEHRRPRYIVLKRNGDEARGWMLEGPILSVRPERRANFIRAWDRMKRYIDDRYVMEAVIEGNNIYRRRDALPETSVATSREN